MSKSTDNSLGTDVKQTETAVKGVGELDVKLAPPLPNLGELPEPPPAQHVDDKKTATEVPKESEGGADDCETPTDELQDAWLVSLQASTQGLNARVALLEAQGSAAIKHAEAEGKVTDNALRKDMADKTFHFMERWCMFVGMITFIYVAKHDGDPPKEFMLALLGTCTISIIGLVGFVVSGLFKSSGKSSS